ncbi:MAG: single-stranded-DNA-specific exonuclease RecJ [Trueperaceae bacterium]
MSPPAPPAAVECLVRELGVPPLLAAMLWNRGFRDDAASQLRPPLVPTAIPELGTAAARLEDAMRRKERILIHGDYDADGISGTALLLLGLRALGANVAAFIPDRLSDGYGVHSERIDEHVARCDLFLTVDCGISNIAEVARLRAAGVDVIVTDHHHPGQDLPDCLVMHPSLSPNAGAGQAELTGAGVAYHLLWALHERLGLEAPLEYSDIATIGTIADVAPLLGENRALVQAGLQRLADSRWPGLRASVAQASLRHGVTARDVAFVLAPRLNAAGRLGEADMGLELLTTASERRARELAAYLDARNQDRRKIQDDMFAEALLEVDHDAPALVLASDDWHPGVMGIVASKLLELVYKPVFIIAKGKGSVRSTLGISAVAALDSASEHLQRYGGHAQAAGFAIANEQIELFREGICRFVAAHPVPEPRLAADAAVTAGEVDAELYRAMSDLEPFGEGNPAPVLALSDRLEVARAVGKGGGTLQLRIAGLRGVAWQKGALASSLRTGDFVNAAISVREREWKGKRELEFVASEIRPLAPLALSETSTSLIQGNGAQAKHGGSPVRRGRAPAGTPLLDADGANEAPAIWITRLPASPDPLAATSQLRDLLAAGTILYLDLDEPALAEARRTAQLLPTVADVRRGFVCLQRGAKLPFEPAKQSLVRVILTELDLLDPHGRVRRGEKRDPHSSGTMMSALIESYRLSTLLNAYRSLDDSGFSAAALTLLSD